MHVCTFVCIHVAYIVHALSTHGDLSPCALLHMVAYTDRLAIRTVIHRLIATAFIVAALR